MNENEKNRERKRRAGDNLSMGLPLKLGPDIHPIVRPQVPSCHGAFRLKFDPDAELLPGLSVAVGDVSKERPRCPAPIREIFALRDG